MFCSSHRTTIRDSRFDPEDLAARLHDVSFRIMRDADRPICRALYRANEAAHFPPGLIGRYDMELRHGRFLNLVALRHGETVGCGALYRNGPDRYCLAYGMVAPAHHRQGIGSALLLARLAMLDPAADAITVSLFAANSGSVAFYRRFGFHFPGQRWEVDGELHPHGLLRIEAAQIRRCRDLFVERATACADEPATPPARVSWARVPDAGSRW